MKKDIPKPTIVRFYKHERDFIKSKAKEYNISKAAVVRRALNAHIVPFFVEL